MNIRAIIPAAGKGTRLGTGEGDVPKVMRICGGRPLLETVLDSVRFIPRENVYIVVGYKKDCVTGYFGEGYHYVEQKIQKGTGHAVMACADEFRDYDGVVLVTFGDMPLFRAKDMKAMCRLMEKEGASCVLMSAENPSLDLWARIIRDENGDFSAIVEGKDCTPEQAKTKELFAGVLCFDSKALFETIPGLGTNNVQGEYYLTEVPELMRKKGMKVLTYMIKDGNDLRGVNTPEDLKLCEEELLKRKGSKKK
ncbi:MAG: NTP transferase domain-containing protein [Clostridia bacterium]|nr:NTP transferase domain-containing protein [Clostridia bacterium]